MGDLFESVFFFGVFANIPINVYTVLIKTFTMHVEDVSMEIACKSAVYEYVIRYCFIIK